MRFLILVLLFSSVAFGSELQNLLEKKSENYKTLNVFYSKLLADVKAGNTTAFCDAARNHVSVLSDILEDDQVLMRELRKSSNTDYLEYATHIEENSISPLFSAYAFIDTCDNNPAEILKLTTSLQYHVTNVDYLSMVNDLFRQTVQK